MHLPATSVGAKGYSKGLQVWGQRAIAKGYKCGGKGLATVLSKKQWVRSVIDYATILVEPAMSALIKITYLRLEAVSLWGRCNPGRGWHTKGSLRRRWTCKYISKLSQKMRLRLKKTSICYTFPFYVPLLTLPCLAHKFCRWILLQISKSLTTHHFFN